MSRFPVCKGSAFSLYLFGLKFFMVVNIAKSPMDTKNKLNPSNHSSPAIFLSFCPFGSSVMEEPLWHFQMS
jgi:hypothetical protein